MQVNHSNINDMFSGTDSYPLEILSKENRKLLKILGIVCHCPSLGCPKKNSDTEEEKLRCKASGECNGKEENLKKFVMGLLCLLLKKTSLIATNLQYYWYWWLFWGTMCSPEENDE